MVGFADIVPLDLEDDYIIIYIDMVLLMGWVDLPKLFCAFPETFTDIENALVDTEIPVPAYGAIAKIPTTRMSPPQTCESMM